MEKICKLQWFISLIDDESIGEQHSSSVNDGNRRVNRITRLISYVEALNSCSATTVQSMTVHVRCPLRSLLLSFPRDIDHTKSSKSPPKNRQKSVNGTEFIKKLIMKLIYLLIKNPQK